jgi:hypothetical protein
MKTPNQSVPSTQMSRVVRGGFPDRQFDVDFWQQQGDQAIFEAAWEMTGLAEEFKGTRVELKPDFKELLRPFTTWRNSRLSFSSVARVDVMTSIDAATFGEAWKHRVQTHLGDIPISIISLQHLIQNKEAANRDTNQIHLARLRKYGKQS